MKSIGRFITIFHKGKYINEKEDRVMVMHIENFTKPLSSIPNRPIILFQIQNL